MYCVLDGKNIIAFHEEYRVVEAYTNLIKKYHNINLEIGKVKRKKIKGVKDFDDLYLVRYRDTYVQAGYLEYLQILTDDYIYDYRYTKEVLMRFLQEPYTLSLNDTKTIKKTIKILDKILADEEAFVPDFNSLKQMEFDYEPYIYNKRIWEIDDREDLTK